MGTNFYMRETSVDVVSQEAVYEDMHIGKRSGGWVFGFSGVNHRSVMAWRFAIKQYVKAGFQIVDEYGTPYTPEEFWEAVEATKKPWGPKKTVPLVNAKSQFESDQRKRWVDEGFSFYNGEFC